MYAGDIREVSRRRAVRDTAVLLAQGNKTIRHCETSMDAVVSTFYAEPSPVESAESPTTLVALHGAP